MNPDALADERPSAQTPERRDSDARTALVILLVAAVLFIALRARMISVPFERDEGEYAYVAQRLAHGDAPYRDAFLQKTPAAAFVYAAAFAIADEGIESVHLMLYAFTAATALLLYRLIAAAAGRVAGAVAVLAFSLTSIEPRLLASAANTEQFALLPLTAGIAAALLARQRHSWRWSAASGACCLAAFWFKQVALAPAMVAPLILLGGRGHRPFPDGHDRPRDATPARLAAWLAGGTVVSTIAVAYIALSDAWAAFVDCAFAHNWAYAQRVSPSDGWTALVARLAEQWPSMFGVWLLAAIVLAWPRGAVETALADAAGDARPSSAAIRPRELGLWLILSFIAVAAPMNFYHHYFVWLLPPLCGLAGIGAGRLLQAVGRTGPAAVRGKALVRRAMPTAVAVGVTALIALPTLVANRAIWLAAGPRAVSSLLYRQNAFWESVEIGRFIRSAGEPSDSVFILGSEPQILFYANRRSASRYTIMYPLFGPYADAEGRQEEVLEEIARDRPRWILDVRLENSLTPDKDAPTLLLESVSAMLLPGQGYRLSGLVVAKVQQRRFVTLFGEEARRHADLYGLPEVGILIFERR
ncbi:MAG: hypothetical protein C4547_06370 [Phycisphaerales bacterium]|nr:MAG: hypothetical protein C4547_06370 [Phycisphaerales bacterium]